MLSARCTLGLVLLLVLTGSVATPLYAQISARATPYSVRANLVDDVPSYTLYQEPAQKPAPQLRRVEEDGFFITAPAQPGLEIPVDLGFDDAGRWTPLPDGGRLWRMRLASEGTTSLHLVYDDFWMPEGAQLFLYNDDRSVVLGAFTQRNNKPYGRFSTDFVPGEATTLEYYEPAGAEPGRLHIAMAIQGWEEPASASKGAETSAALSCSIDVACTEEEHGWTGWDDAIRSVVQISNGCTGVLVNNEEENEIPYVLTVNHCGWPSVGETVDWVFKFGYESSTCTNPESNPSFNSISGATVRAASSSGDFTLLELSAPIPAEYDVYFAGWSIEDNPSLGAAVIGHPVGDIKKITMDDDQLGQFGSGHWQSIFDHGTIEGGSSGSPLFNADHELIGFVKTALFYDPNACIGPGGDDNAANVLMPKLSALWGLGLQQYLDPKGTGTMAVPFLQGTGSLLPVELVSFDATLDGQSLDLRWKTASETNNAGFEIQRTTDADQGPWQVLGWVEGHGTTLEPQRYTYRVDGLQAGMHRFRLKQIDFDGAFEYSPEVEVAVGIPTSYHLSSAYPNPFNPETQFSVSVARAQQVQVAVYDVVGRRVAVLHDGLLEAQTTQALRFEAGSLPSGMYLVQVLGEYFVTSQTITLVK